MRGSPPLPPPTEVGKALWYVLENLLKYSMLFWRIKLKRTTREERENAKKAEAERKRSAARAQQAARRTAARPPPAPREAGQLDDAATRPAARQQRSRPQTGSKRVYTCSVCRCQGHSAKRKEGVAQCPRQQAAAAAAAAAAACDE